MKIRSLLLALVGLFISANAFASSFAVELLFEFSPSTNSRQNYQGNIIGHEAVFVDLKATSFDAAITEAAQMIGTNCSKSLRVTTCHRKNGKRISNSECDQMISEAKIIGVNLNKKVAMHAYDGLCTIGDSLTSFLYPCPM